MFCATTFAATADVALMLADPSGVEPAQDDAFRTVVETEPDRALEEQRALDRDTPGFGAAVDLGRRDGTPDDGLTEVLARTPGAHVRSVGGLGQFTAISLRGSAAAQVMIFADGVPLGDAFGGLFNLSDLPLRSMSRVDIYRGFVPVRYGGATLGGALDVDGRPRSTAPQVSLSTGLGSFGGRQLALDGVTALTDRLTLSAHASYAGATGDFPYYDDASTPTFTGDDETLRRRNNDYDRAIVRARLDGERGPVRGHVQQWFVGRSTGIAGPVGAPSAAARLGTLGLQTIARIEHTSFGRPGGRLGAHLGLGLRQQRFRDPQAELGPGINDQRMRSLDLYASPRWRSALWRMAFAELTADIRPQWVRVDEAASTGLASGDATRSRLGVGVGVQLEQFLAQRRVRLVPAVRVDAFSNRFAAAPGEGEVSDEGRDVDQFGASPRMGASVRVVGPLQLRGSIGRYFRVPTLLELFGDRGYAVGNEGLRPERGTNADGGVVIDHDGDALQFYGQLAGFATWSEDLITWVSAGRVARAVNLAAARIRGAEVSARALAFSERLELDASYTFTDAVDRGPDPTARNQPLVGRPRHDASTHVSLGRRFVARGVEWLPRIRSGLEVLSGTRLDTAGRYEVPTRVLQSIGVELHVDGRVHWALEVRNLLDQRTGPVVLPVGDRRPSPAPIADYLGYPLPGRSLWTSLTLDFGGPR
ncbi:MAG: TonB-dependent receptor plug domain-containing protein [Nannocystaceae bacterium]|nr:TonB-dependent receptor [bacterium]